MDSMKDLLLDIWREVCQHNNITESLPIIAGLIRPHMPLRQIAIRRVDPLQSSVDTLALGFEESASDFLLTKEYGANEIRKIADWHRENRTMQLSSRNGIFDLLLPSKPGGDVIACPLKAQKNILPVLLFISEQQAFHSLHVEMAEQLVEPFKTAIENDMRLREIVRLREASEADKKTLLAKLSRSDIGDVIIGNLSGLKTVMERVDLVATSDVPVLIFGETGTGKELIARAIHRQSAREGGPFIRVNCGAIPSELIDSQLFGHEKGSFTGATESRKGWFERADGGSLFLDEIGEMPMAAQVRLLRILQDGWMERVGGRHAIKVDVRIVLATNRDLASMVTQGKFRDDLWYRISTFPIFLPPLRNRLEDMRALADYFARRSSIRFGLSFIKPTPKDIRILSSYMWPGNIRELGTVIDRAALLGNGRTLEIEKALGWLGSVGVADTPMQGENGTPFIPGGGIESLDEVIKRHIETVLTLTRGRIEGEKGAATALKINPHTLRARMRKLKIDWAKFRD